MIDEKQLFWDIRFAQLAKLVSLWSKDPSTKVGSVIVRPDKTIASVGYNGFPKGIPDNPDWYDNRDIKYKVVKHAEENDILFSQQSLVDHTLYVYPLPPCSSCAGDIIQRGIKRVVAVVPPAQQSRMSDPNFGFDLTATMFKHADIQFDILEDDVNLCDLERKL